MVMKLVEVEVEIDSDEVLSEISTGDLIAELEARDDSPAQPDWNRLYELLSTKRDGDALSFVRQLVEQKTGRIIP